MDEKDLKPEVPAIGATFRLEQLFGSRTRARLLGLFLENAEQSYYVRELARRVDAQLNAVRRELKNLVELGLVKEGDGAEAAPALAEGEEETGGREQKRFYKANATFPLFEDLRRVMKKAAVLMNRSLLDDLKKSGDLSLLVLTGRFTDLGNVPTDVLIVGDLDATAVAQAVQDFERDIGREVNYTAMPREEFLYRHDIGDRFLASILDGRRVVLWDSLGFTK